MDRIKFSTLDAIRGIAALIVAVRHSGEFFGGNPFYHSFLAVDVFFLLSGFVIAHAYDSKIMEGRLSTLQFMVIRLIRLYPLYLISLVFSLVVLTIKTEHPIQNIYLNIQVFGNYLLGLFYLPSFLQKITPSTELFLINVVFWSLFYEIVANLAFVLCRKFLNTPILLLIISLNALLILFFASKDGNVDNGFYWGLGSIALGGARAFFGIFLGLYLYRIFKNGSRYSKLSGSTIVPIIIISSVLLMPSFGSYNALFQCVAIFLVFPLCVLWSANTEQNVVYSKYLITLGLISYPAYVLHIPATQLLNLFWKQEIRLFAPYTGFIFIFTFFVICIHVEKYIERPFRHYLRFLAGNIVKG